MIQKLLDEPYWTELESHLRSHFGLHERVFLSTTLNQICLHSLMRNLALKSLAEPSRSNSSFSLTDAFNSMSDLNQVRNVLIHETFSYLPQKEKFLGLESQCREIQNLEIIFDLLHYKLFVPFLNKTHPRVKNEKETSERIAMLQTRLHKLCEQAS